MMAYPVSIVATLTTLASVLAGSLLTAPIALAVSPASHQGLLLAQSTQGCEEGESTFVITETENYWIYICGGDYPGSYVGVEKQNPSNAIRLPLSDYDPQGNYFEAVNGDVIYILARTPRGTFLTVTQGTEELLREPVLQPW